MPESYEPGQYEYHYNKDERLERQSEWLKHYRRPVSFYQRNRMTIIIFADIVFIALVFLVFNPFSLLGSPKLAGYRVSARAFYYREEALVTITLQGSDKDAGNGGDGEAVLVELLYDRDGEQQSVAVRDTAATGGETKIRSSIALPDPPDIILARITISGDTRELKIPLEKE
ncbi:MAG: hypothetical protein JXB03_04930 [Spirochaetales bacterium]|nr:hypothetical protein [Spirochaetales bacterium]